MCVCEPGNLKERCGNLDHEKKLYGGLWALALKMVRTNYLTYVTIESAFAPFWVCFTMRWLRGSMTPGSKKVISGHKAEYQHKGRNFF